MENIHLVGISGSLRAGSFNTMLINTIADLVPEGMTIDIVSFKDLPLYNGDFDLPIASERPAEVAAFRDQLVAADGYVIATPEYNYSIPGPLKNAIDWASRGKDSPILNKAVALMGATPGMWGTIRSQNAFHPIFQAVNWASVRKPEVFINKAGDKFKDGKLADEATREMVRTQLIALRDLIIAVKNKQSWGGFS